MQTRGWAAFILLVSTLLAVLPVAAKIVDYGAEGWLWALFGLCQRRYVDGIAAVGSVRRNSTLVSIRVALRPETAGLMRLLACLVARGRLRLAGTKGILVSGNSFSRLYFGPRRSVHQPVSIQAWREPHPTARSHSRRPPLRRSAHFGNLRHPACRLRTPCKVGARSRPLTRDSRPRHTLHAVGKNARSDIGCPPPSRRKRSIAQRVSDSPAWPLIEAKRLGGSLRGSAEIRELLGGAGPIIELVRCD